MFVSSLCLPTTLDLLLQTTFRIASFRLASAIRNSPKVLNTLDAPARLHIALATQHTSVLNLFRRLSVLPDGYKMPTTHGMADVPPLACRRQMCLRLELYHSNLLIRSACIRYF